MTDFPCICTVENLKLSDKEKKAVREFIRTVRLAYGDKIQEAALFGSKVRGDAKRYSDVDILLIVNDEKWKYRQPFSVILSDIALKYDVLIDVRVIRDAVPIRFRKISPTAA